MKRPPYEAVVFDLDGTLVDSYDALQNSINHVLAVNGTGPISRLHLMSLVGEGVTRLLEKAFDGRPVPPSAAADFEEHYDVICSSQSRLLDDVLETVEAIAGQGLPMTVCTNKPTRFSVKILDALGLAGRFVTVAGPDTAGARKPDPEHIRFSLRQTGIAPEQALMVGDMPIDIEAARNAGMHVAVIATGSSSLETLEAALPDYMLAGFRDLIGIVSAQR